MIFQNKYESYQEVSYCHPSVDLQASVHTLEHTSQNSYKTKTKK